MKRYFIFVILTLFSLSAQPISEYKLTPNDAVIKKDQFGFSWSIGFGNSVSISGDYAIIGAFEDIEYGSFSGSAYIFKRIKDKWIQQTKLGASDAYRDEWFGYSVAICGDYAIIGAPSSTTGSAYIFKRVGEKWIEQVKLVASDNARGNDFGNSVSICGDYAIIGAQFYGENRLELGSAYIFRRIGEKWIEQQKITPTDQDRGDRFGYSVSISSRFAAVGKIKNAVYIFKQIGEKWIQQQKISPNEINDPFEIFVAISDDYVILAPVVHKKNRVHSVYIFKRKNIRWVYQDKITKINHHFGNSVSISGDYAIVGEYARAYIIKRVGEKWTEKAVLIPGYYAPVRYGTSNWCGNPVAISGDFAIIGTPGENSAYIYKLDFSSDVE